MFVEVSGSVASPCAIGAPAANVVEHCTAHVVLANNGGEGLAHVTIVVPLKDAKGGSAPIGSAKCGRAVEDTPAGGRTDLTCNFDLPPGQSVASYPFLGSVEYIAASPRGSSGFDFAGAGVVVLAGAVTVLAFAVLLAGPWRKVAVAHQPVPADVSRRPEVSPKVSRKPQPPPQRGEHQPDLKTQNAIDSEYDLPSIPR